MNTTLFWLLLILLFLELAVIAAVFLVRHWLLKRRNERCPVTEKLLRPAGESLRVEVEKLDEQGDSALMKAILVPFIAFIFPGLVQFLHLPLSNGAQLGITFLAWLVILGWCVTRCYRNAQKWRNCNLGFHGERAVGEEINQLMRDGCRVFHDVPNNPYGNIDHVIVAPSGVYAVETKTRRKKKAPPGKKEHEIIYDGKTLEFPHCRDSHGLDQARQQADQLRVLLTKAVGEAVKVSPILTFPGWFVTSRVNTGMKVVNPKQIRHVVLNSGDTNLTPQLIERISYQLDQLCRDVEL